MFEKMTGLAERLACSGGCSRRRLFSRLGQAALGTAGALAALLALSGKAQANAHIEYVCRYYGGFFFVNCGNCPPFYHGYKLFQKQFFGYC
jgi:hypothetical protein